MNLYMSKNLEIQGGKYSAFALAFLTFVGLFKILLRSLRCKKSGGIQESCTLVFYHQKEFSLKISHFESVCIGVFGVAPGVSHPSFLGNLGQML